MWRKHKVAGGRIITLPSLMWACGRNGVNSGCKHKSQAKISTNITTYAQAKQLTTLLKPLSLLKPLWHIFVFLLFSLKCSVFHKPSQSQVSSIMISPKSKVIFTPLLDNLWDNKLIKSYFILNFTYLLAALIILFDCGVALRL